MISFNVTSRSIGGRANGGRSCFLPSVCGDPIRLLRRDTKMMEEEDQNNERKDRWSESKQIFFLFFEGMERKGGVNKEQKLG